MPSKNAPLKVHVAEQLRQMIHAGAFAPGSMLESERKLCERTEVSRITVRAALDILEKEGCIRRRPRKGTIVLDPWRGEKKQEKQAQRRTKTLAYLRWETEPSTIRQLEGVQGVCSEVSADMVVFDANGSEDKLLGYLYHLPFGVDGVIVSFVHTKKIDEAIRNLIQRHVRPVVCIGHKVDIEVSSVAADNYAAGFTATKHLIHRWQRPVYYLGGNLSHSMTYKDRNRGWRAAMDEHGFHEWDEFFVEDPTPGEQLVSRTVMRGGYERALHLFDTCRPSNGGWSIFANNDYLARGAYKAAQKKGLKVGTDVAVVGFCDLPFAADLDPPMSSIRVDMQAIGKTAAELLYSMSKGRYSVVVHQTLPVSLIERESSTGNSQKAVVSASIYSSTNGNGKIDNEGN